MCPVELPPTRVLRHPLGRWIDPADAWAALLADEPNSFWLDSGQGAGTSYLGAGGRVIGGSGVFDDLRSELAENRVDVAGQGFALGWVGWLGYELRSVTLGTPVARSSRYPDAALMYVDRALAFDHATGEVTLLALGREWTGDLAEWRASTIAALASRVVVPGEFLTGETFPREKVPGLVSPRQFFPEKVLPRHPAPALAEWAYSDAEYLGMIAECQAAIRAGDAYQLCLTTEARVAGEFDPFRTYLALRESSPAHHGGLIRIGGVALLSASPEQFLGVSPDGVVESKPIKGTRPRGETVEADDAFCAELLASDKERAENLMIVDLMRNDIGRVSELGTVVVSSLFAVETYRHVHQLVSTVRGRLLRGRTGVDAVEVCFPAGSMTGAPKRAATLILEGLEARPRGIYAGAFGYFGLDGRVDLAMVIRSIVLDGAGATVGAGGGITALSVPEEELAEARLKAAALLTVLGAG
ncbi:anthranilate synthase component 1 [Conyzicola lurida]|uniref:Anthranilate synthase component 1 n=1 Tax=Conyzicola lurida TaxID=1172621 RepID=A0A841APC1_9MICO|nr:anthranilate synthase component I family protein [Conyzicola lurida]MBB5843433.1 anthranilate synthase component 1 [Conyzicola lurida]